MEYIRIRGARTHNLQSIDLDLPRDKLIVITGLSGSGKSSLAFDTIYAEGQRRYVESLSAYARQFLSMMEKPDVDHIEGLSPAISIEQKSTSHNPRSTVGTITEIYDYLRLLFARAGEPRCATHGVTLEAQTVSQMVDKVLALPEGARLMLLAPVVEGRKGEHAQVFDSLRSQGYVRARVDGEVVELDRIEELDRRRKHTIEAVVDRFKVRGDQALRLAESFETALALGDGRARVAWMDDPAHEELLFSARFACSLCGYSLPELEPRMFSFNNPAGACGACDGLGVSSFFDPARVVHHDELSLPGGAIRGWDRRNAYYFQLITALASHYEFDLDTPFRELPERVRQVILHGSGKECIRFNYLRDGRNEYVREHPFEGVIPNMERRYRETESSVVREELAKYLATKPCDVCGGTRLNQYARNVFLGDHSLPAITAKPVGQALEFLTHLTLPGYRGQIADRILKEINQRLQFLIDVGLDYLALDRSADTLSGGEAQRIRLASQIGAGLVGVMYVLDEPSIGLHQRDNRRLLDTLHSLRDMGNTVIVVEHDEEAIHAADHVVDMGPGAGAHGGRVVAEGTPQHVASNSASLTGQYISGRRQIAVPDARTPFDENRVLCLRGASGNNLKHIDLELPLGLMTCITGVSGSGKSTLVNDTLYRIAARELNDASTDPAPHDSIEGLEHLDKVVDIDQSPIGRTPRSNPATYTGLFTPIRELFAGTHEARSRGYGPGRFSFNVRGGRCEACSGDGVIKVEMHFLPDVYVPCDLCKGKRYNRETLDIRYKGRNIHEVLEMTVEEAHEFFRAVPSLSRKLRTLIDVGLSYIHLGQRATTLSGGEAQRVKLARELSKRDTGSTLYILDEPTTGLHFHDIEQLLRVLHRLRDHGNAVVVVEHNLDVIKTADWIVDLGLEGGDGGGEIVVAGTPEDVALHPRSHTGRFLARILERGRKRSERAERSPGRGDEAAL
ncbi:MAG: excinuclease ABC subunit UvrA [Gammaproteobacteria bacterium]|nr:excinuclease ABC subunit UvrA [Gammaproteobacteria bacterium]NIM72387.1 excinuclease ABC subunit UvrA [Gammaproteobacteria bacterium]NIN40223.1 excinuclease ABC subunit UvrA [Gammaproteobacteria bacterium]NIO24145.1 excinuclease ABC subunit UvrA [Gammaproteobacteria bacterium]NIO65633.1 excinuclease ABC subunit UvrA [Gammaproteobacteria bacterium]